MIALSEPVLGELEEKLVLEVLRSKRLVQGPMVERLEEAIRQVVGTRHAVVVSNGTDALIAALLAHGIGPGDEVITTSFTFVATLNAILRTGATPRFVDIGGDFNLDAQAIPDAITDATRALLPVHLYGQPADMGTIRGIARRHGLAIIEDAAQALGATFAGRPVGSFGTGCFSFYATKNVTTGEGGAVTTDDAEIAAVVRSLRNQGQRARYDYERPGLNLRMTELQAAVGVAQLSRRPDMTDPRRANAAFLGAALTGVQGLITPAVGAGRDHVFHQFTVRVTEDARISRDGLQAELERAGVASAVYYPRPVYDYPCFRSDPRIGEPRTPIAQRIAGEVLSLPIHPGLTSADLSRIADVIWAALA